MKVQNISLDGRLADCASPNGFYGLIPGTQRRQSAYGETRTVTLNGSSCLSSDLFETNHPQVTLTENAINAFTGGSNLTVRCPPRSTLNSLPNNGLSELEIPVHRLPDACA